MTCPPHRWHIAPSRGPWSPGVCKECAGASRWFSNSLPGCWPLDLRTHTDFRAYEPMALSYLAKTMNLWEVQE